MNLVGGLHAHNLIYNIIFITEKMHEEQQAANAASRSDLNESVKAPAP